MEFFKRGALSILFPRRCPLCEKVIDDRLQVCGECENKVEAIKESKCCQCGKPLNQEEKIFCHDCKRMSHVFDEGVAVFEYKNEIKQSLYRFKYDNQRIYADYYGKMAADIYLPLLKSWKVDKIIPIPMHHRKKVLRGYNQAEEFADKLSKYTGIQNDKKCLVRTKNTSPQKGLSDMQRKLNLEKAFAVDVSRLHECKTVLLVDDIYTTGSTMDACARVLKAAG